MINKTIYVILVGGALAACGDDGTPAKTDAPVVQHDAPPKDAPAFPAPPAIGAQVDRFGRPAINTAANHVFDGSASRQGAAKDDYNQDGDVAMWPTKYAPEFAKNLAVLDALDIGVTYGSGGSAVQGGCGNQFAYNGMLGGGGSATASSYMPLAAALADDRLFLDTSKTTCTAYLTVEQDFLSGGGIAHTTCGGRTPSYDVIDISYTALAGGATAVLHGVVFPDGVAKHDDASDSVFPFLGAPH